MRIKKVKNVYYDKRNEVYYIRKKINGEDKTFRHDAFGNRFLTQDSAIQFLKILNTKIYNSPANTTIVRLTPKTGISFYALYISWYQFKSQTWDQSTQYEYLRKIKFNILDHFAIEKDIAELTQQDFDNWRAYMASRNVSTRYKNNFIMHLKSICEYGEDFFDIRLPYAKRLNPFISKEIKTRYSTQTHRRYITDTELIKLFEAIPDDEKQMKAYFLTSVFTGVRIGESLGFKVEDFDYDNKSIYIGKQTKYVGRGKAVLANTKTMSSNRLCYLPDFVCDVIKDYLDTYHIKPTAKSFLFYSPNQHDEKIPLSRRKVERWRRALFKKAGVEYCDSHSIKITFITNSRKIAPLNIVSKAVGHSSEITTARYYDQPEDDESKILAKRLSNKYEKKLRKVAHKNKKH